MYHNIAAPASDPWELAVSPKHFEEQLNVLQKFRVIPVAQLAEEVANKKVISNTVCLTFDDGYEDNLTNAKPLLEKYNCPATFFISHHFINHREAFWWDELAWLILETDSLPENLSLEFGGQSFYFYLGVDAELFPEKQQLQRKWVWHRKPPTKRAELYLELWRLLKPMSHRQIREALGDLYRWAGLTPNIQRSAMNTEQLATLIDNPLIEAGIHTMTHPSLSRHELSFQQKEIGESRQTLINAGFKADLIAYPYGDFNEDSLQVAADLKLAAGFTTAEKVITKDSNIHALGRFQVRNINGARFEKELRRWFAGFPVS